MRLRNASKWCALLVFLVSMALVPTAFGQFFGRGGFVQGFRFRFVGPQRGNRASAVVGVPGDPNVYYVGAASGGIFKSTDGGFRWEPIFDKEPVQSIGTLAIDPNNHSVLWVGTGESWVIRDAITPGDGVYKSVDAGHTWTHVGLDGTALISRIVVDPHDSNNVFVCAMGSGTAADPSSGVWRTEDGGKNWKHVLFVNGNTGCSGLTMDMQNDAVLFAGMWDWQIHPWAMISGGPSSGVYVSRDGGNTWSEIRGHGLPQPPVGKIDVEVAPSDPNRVYALIQTAQAGAMWRSDDGGDNWRVVNYSRLLTERAGYFVRIAVSPGNEDEVLVSCNGFFRSTDGGVTFNEVPWGGDNHDIWFDPTNAKRIMISDDGGAEISTTGGQNWIHASFPIGQMYHVSTDNQIPYWVYANMQDDSSERGPAYPMSTPGAGGGYGAGGNGGWQDDVGGCESGFTYADPTNADIIWSTCYGDEITRLDTKVGYPRAVSPWPNHPLDAAPGSVKYRCHWTPPMAIDPFDPNTVYYGCQVVFKTSDGGQSWQVISPDLSTNNPKYLVPSGGIPINGVMRRPDNLGQFYGEVVFAIGPSPVQRGLIWAGTNDGQVWVTRNGGGHWTNVTANIPNLGPWGTVERIEPSHFDAGTAYLAMDRSLMGDTKPYIYKTTDYGRTWTPIVNGIPVSGSSNVSSVAQDPWSKNLLFAGTENDLYYSIDDGANWQTLDDGLPHAPVSWETVQKTFHDLVVSTFGRGIYVLEDISPLEQLAEAKASSDPVYVFKSRSPYRFNRGAHAYIDFYVKPGTRPGPVSIDITDSSRQTVSTLRTFGRPGINRVYWDLHYPRSRAIELRTTPATNPHVWDELRFLGRDSRPITHWGIGQAEAGPMAAPGTYNVKLSAGGKTYTQALVLQPDPRSPATPAQIAATVKTLRHVTDDISAVADMVNHIEWMRKQLQDVEASLGVNPMGQAAAGGFGRRGGFGGFPGMGGGGGPAQARTPAESKALAAVQAMDKKMQTVENLLLSPALANSDQKSYLAKYALYLHLIWLNGEIGSGAGDVAGSPGYPPTDASLAVLHQLDGELAAAKTQYNNLMQKEVPEFNRTLTQSGTIPLVSKMPASSGSFGSESGTGAGVASPNR